MKILIKNRLKKYKSFNIEEEDIKKSNKILFSVFARYGDGIISFKTIKEFIKKYPTKNYIILTSRQQLPYAKAIINLENITFLKVNKRNPIELFLTIQLLKKENIDLGFNPWGHGDDSEFFITYCKKFSFYKKFDNFSKTYNLYDRIRKYLFLPVIVNKVINKPNFTNITKIIIAPISSDITKNINKKGIDILIQQLKEKFQNCKILIALPKEYKNIDVPVEKFIFSKSIKGSKQYLKELQSSDLFVGVDSGPLHLALALNIDNKQSVHIIRDEKLKDIFCFVRECSNPICINKLFNMDIFKIDYKIDKKQYLEEYKCKII